MSTTKHAVEFLEKLGEKATKNFNLPEAITYGAYLGGLKEGDPLEVLKPLMSTGPAQARMAAISYHYEFGNKNTVKDIAAFENDAQQAPTCEEGKGCDWTCLVGPEGKKKTPKEVKTVGDFVQYCIKPKMLRTEPDDAKKKKKDDGSKGKGKKQGDKGDKKDG